VTAPVFWADSLESAATGAIFTLTGDEAQHAARARRMKPGEHIDIVDGRGTRASMVVTAVRSASNSSVECEVIDVVRERAPRPRIVVIQALAKGDRSERAVEMLTEVGVDVIVPWSAQRSVAVWSGDRSERGVQRWRATAREAMKQSRRSWQPEVAQPVDMAGACRWIEQSAHAVVLDAEGIPLPRVVEQARGVGDQVGDEAGDWAVVVGPEGGCTDSELRALTGAGAQRASLGPTILRTSTAGTVATGVLAALLRWSTDSAQAGHSVTGSAL
jgi:16S rRNA (uracil1498-N3)-methyltransferase